MNKYQAHPTAVIDEGALIGEGCTIWHFCHISGGSSIGKGCTLGQNVYVAPKVNIGQRVKIQNNVSLFTGVIVEDDVFLGTCLIAYFLDYCTDDTARTLRSSYRAPEFCHFDETI